MSTVAEQLRTAREAKHLTVQQVAEITKMRTDHLRALEEGNFDVFSAPVYIRGFVRSYSTLLKLEVPRIMAELESELGKTNKFAEPPPLSDRPRGLVDFITLQFAKVDWRKGVVVVGIAVVLLAALLVYLVAKRYRSSDPLQSLEPGLYNSTQRISSETLPLPPPAPTPKR